MVDVEVRCPVQPISASERQTERGKPLACFFPGGNTVLLLFLIFVYKNSFFKCFACFSSVQILIITFFLMLKKEKFSYLIFLQKSKIKINHLTNSVNIGYQKKRYTTIKVFRGLFSTIFDYFVVIFRFRPFYHPVGSISLCPSSPTNKRNAFHFLTR